MSSSYLTDLAQGLSPYIPGEQPKGENIIKLNTNENPYEPSLKVLEAIRDAEKSLRLYPDPASLELAQSIANFYGIEKENVFVGNGSDEVLALSFPAFFSGRKIAYPDITYSFYPVYARLFGAEAVEVPLQEDFSIRVSEFNFEDIQGILIPNPNAPTGRALELDEIEEIVKSNSQALVLIDEAYVDFGCRSAVSLIPRYDNLLVTQTFSKSRSLAGLRVGFAMGNPELIRGMTAVKDSFNSYPLDRLAQAGARAAIEDREYFEEICARITASRERTKIQMEGMGFHIIPSSANFVFACHERVPAETIFQKLREKNILVRYFNKPRIDNYLRITIGTDAEMDLFLSALGEILSLYKSL